MSRGIKMISHSRNLRVFCEKDFFRHFVWHNLENIRQHRKWSTRGIFFSKTTDFKPPELKNSILGIEGNTHTFLSVFLFFFYFGFFHAKKKQTVPFFQPKLMHDKTIRTLPGEHSVGLPHRFWPLWQSLELERQV